MKTENPHLWTVTCPGLNFFFLLLAQTLQHICMMLSCPTYQLLHKLLHLDFNSFKAMAHMRLKSFRVLAYKTVCLNTAG